MDSYVLALSSFNFKWAANIKKLCDSRKINPIKNMYLIVEGDILKE